MENMRFKVGDRVRIKSLDWYNKNKDEDGDVPGAFFCEKRSLLCGTVQTISSDGHKLASGTIIYSMENLYEFIGEEAIEGLAEFTDDRLLAIAKDAWDKVDSEMQYKYEKERNYADREFLAGKEVMAVLTCSVELPSGQIRLWELPDGYEFLDEKGNVINATKIVLMKKRSI